MSFVKPGSTGQATPLAGILPVHSMLHQRCRAQPLVIHMCVLSPAPGGYAVLKGIQRGMNLPTDMMLPSFATLRDFGNTSSSTTWYSIAYLETLEMITKGQQLMQVRELTGFRWYAVLATYLGWITVLLAGPLSCMHNNWDHSFALVLR